MANPAPEEDEIMKAPVLDDSPGPRVALHELELDAGSITDIFRAVAATVAPSLKRAGLNGDDLRRALSQREREGSTAIGSGNAIPHARVEGLNESILLDVKLRKPLRWDEGEVVERCMVILVPAEDHAEHLRLTARAIRRLDEEA